MWLNNSQIKCTVLYQPQAPAIFFRGGSYPHAATCDLQLNELMSLKACSLYTGMGSTDCVYAYCVRERTCINLVFFLPLFSQFYLSFMSSLPPYNDINSRIWKETTNARNNNERKRQQSWHFVLELPDIGLDITNAIERSGKN